MTTTDPTAAACEASWGNCDGVVPGEAPHRCDRPLDHRSDHECGCGQQTPRCGVEYAPQRRDPTARIVRCDLAAGHADGHQELYTTVTWPQQPAPAAPDPSTVLPATPGDALRKRLRDAKRHLFAHIIASAHLLDKPFTNAPDQSPWTRLKQAMGDLKVALAELDAARATPPERQPSALDKAAHSVWLHGRWRWLTRQMTTEEREAFADAVDRVKHRHNADDPELNASPVDRWWRDDAPLSTTPPAGTHATEPGCSTCGTCMQHDSCRDEQNPPGAGDCTDCGACAPCIAECADERRADPPAGTVTP